MAKRKTSTVLPAVVFFGPDASYARASGDYMSSIHNDVLDTIRAHRSIRRFRSDPVPDEVLAEVIGAAQCAATSSFVQACSVIRVRSTDTREQMAELAGGQPYVASAPVFLVFCADLARAQTACAMHQREMLQGYTEQFMVATVDVALMAQTAVLAAESLGLGICYIGGLRNHPTEFSQLLRLPQQVYPVFGLCMGYPDADPERKPRLPLELVLHEETYAAAPEAELRAYDERLRAYYGSRSSNRKVAGWTEQIGRLMAEKVRPHMREFLRGQGFTFR